MISSLCSDPSLIIYSLFDLVSFVSKWILKRKKSKSTKISKQPPILLPSEIWISIFRLVAAEPSGPFNCSPLGPASLGERAWTYQSPSPPEWDWVSPTPEYQEYRDRVNTRLSLILVSKHWHYLSIDLLYQYVVLRHEYAMWSFAQALQADYWRLIEENGGRVTKDVAVLHRGRYTKHLRLYLYDTKLQDWASSEREATVASFKHCTHLQTLVVRSYGSMVEGLVAASVMSEIVENGCGLRYLKGNWDPSSLIQTVVQQANTIEVLSFTLLSSKSADSPWMDAPALLLPRLHTLEIESIDNNILILHWLALCELPALQRLTLRRRSLRTAVDWTSIEASVKFFAAHGPNITCLNVASMRDPAFGMILLPYCTSIREVTCHLYAFDSLQTVLPELASVGIALGFDSQAAPGRGIRMMRELERCMNTLFEQHSSTSLVSVRLVAFDFADFSMSRWKTSQLTLWANWIAKWKAKGVRFEFSSGDLVELPAVLDSDFYKRF
jgi:hypothetical protein